MVRVPTAPRKVKEHNRTDRVPLKNSGRKLAINVLVVCCSVALATTTFWSLPALANAVERASVCEPKNDFNNLPIVWSGGYADMPYMAKLPDGRVGMVITVGSGREGAEGQHIVWLTSNDGGRTWSPPTPLEPESGPGASWGMPFVKENRIYVVYTYNTRNQRTWPYSEGGGASRRVDMLGDMALRYSDDGGLTWSKRIMVPIPRTYIDNRNGFKGAETIFWMSGAPVFVGDEIMLGISKGGQNNKSYILPDTEGFLLTSSNPEDPSSWRLLPKGDHGFKAPNGDGVTEEPSMAITRGGRLLVVMRTSSGKVLQAIRRIEGTEEEAFQLSWAKHVDGRDVANPRAKAMIHTFSNGQTILWHHNNDYRDFNHRNLVYVSCTVASSGEIRWSEPRLLFCASDENARMSYPSVVETGEDALFAFTNKEQARVAKIPLKNLCP